jgi:hypothetical protein
MTQPDVREGQSTPGAPLSRATLAPEVAVGLAPPAAAQREPLWRRTMRIASLVIVFGVALEGTARIQDWVRFGMPVLSRVTGESDLMMRDRDGMHGRPNAQYRKWVMNDLGLRGPDVPAVKAPGTVRVAMLGASEMFGLYESPDHELPRQLADTLAARLAAGACGAHAPTRFEVLNAALPGMSLPTVDQDVRMRLARLGLDIAVYYPSPVQYLDDRAPFPAPPDSSDRSHDLPIRGVLHPRIADAMRDEIKKHIPKFILTWLRRRSTEAMTQAHPPGWRFTAVPPARLARYDADLRHLVGTIDRTGATPVLATHANVFMVSRRDDRHLLPAWERFYPRATGPTIIAFDSVARFTTMRVAADSGLVLADVAAELPATPGDHFADFVHFTDAGAATVAAELAPAVLAAARRRGVCGE